MKRVGIIMAGGAGERFWPLSRRKFPKQLLHLNSETQSMVEEALNRIASIIDTNDIFIITNELLTNVMRENLPMLPPENIIPEPYKRNTAPCLALVSAYIAARYDLLPNELSIAVITADQNISPEDKFVSTVNYAMSYAEKNNELVTIGITPTRPETGYGYIETLHAFDLSENLQMQKVLKFREKPNSEQAADFIKKGNFTWNSGMFFWRYDTFLDEMQLHTPEISSQIPAMTSFFKGRTNFIYNQLPDEIILIFAAFPSISIDYALMEKSANVAVCKSIFSWDDIGSWDSLDRTKLHDENSNIITGNVSLVNSNNSIFINKCKDKSLILAGLELKNMVVIATDDAILVCPKDRVQDVKKSVEDIKSKFNDKYL